MFKLKWLICSTAKLLAEPGLCLDSHLQLMRGKVLDLLFIMEIYLHYVIYFEFLFECFLNESSRLFITTIFFNGVFTKLPGTFNTGVLFGNISIGFKGGFTFFNMGIIIKFFNGVERYGVFI